MTTRIEIRAEAPGDEEAIDTVNCRAFGQMDEAHLVRLLRQSSPGFDRRFSVTAFDGDLMVGHTLFNPANIRLMGATVRALAVAPVAVLPEYQRQGIGGQMLAYGHELGKAEGFALAFLCGHPGYYPRHGYKACFGFASVKIDVEKLPEPGCRLHPWPVLAADLPWLMERSAAEWADVDFSWQWGNCLSEWTRPGTNALIWRTDDGRRAAYTLGWPGRKKLKLVLADEPAMARDAIATIKPEALEHHPAGWLARNALDGQWAAAEVKSSGAAMARELQDGVLAPLRGCPRCRQQAAGLLQLAGAAHALLKPPRPQRPRR